MAFLFGIHSLLCGSYDDGLDKLFNSKSIFEPRDADTVAVLLKDNGYNEASIIFSASYQLAMTISNPSKNDENAFMSFCSLPEKFQEPVTKLLIDQCKTRPSAAKRMMMALIMLYVKEPLSEDDRLKALYQLTLRIGDATGLLSMDIARQLAWGKKSSEAKEVTTLILKAHPTDVNVHIDGWRLYYLIIQDKNAAAELLHSSMGAVHEPGARLLRMVALTSMTADEVKMFVLDPYPLLSADALLVLGNSDEATTKYQVVLDDNKDNMPERFGAWCGLLESAPEIGIKRGNSLLNEASAQLPVSIKAEIAPWCAWQLWMLVGREVKLSKLCDYPISLQWKKYRSVRNVDGWESSVANLLSQTLALDPAQCMKTVSFHTPLTEHDASLRLSSSIIFALANQSERATNILFQTTSDLSPNTTGTEFSQNNSTPQFDKTARLCLTVFDAIASNTHADETVPQLASSVMDQLLKRLKTVEQEKDAKATLQLFAACIRLSVSAIEHQNDAIKGNSVTDVTRFKPVESCIQQAFALNVVARDPQPLFIPDGLCVIEKTNNADLVKSLSALTLQGLRRCLEVSGDTARAASITEMFCGRYLDSRDDLKPLANQLRNSFPRKY
jgi:hypothetical protein